MYEIDDKIEMIEMTNASNAWMGLLVLLRITSFPSTIMVDNNTRIVTVAEAGKAEAEHDFSDVHAWNQWIKSYMGIMT